MVRKQVGVDDDKVALLLVHGSRGLAAVHIQQLQDTFLVFGNTAGNQDVEITVGGQNFDMLGVLQLLNAAPGLARVVRLKVVGRVGLPKVLLLGGDPLVVLDVILNLKGVDEKKDIDIRIRGDLLIFKCKDRSAFSTVAIHPRFLI